MFSRFNGGLAILAFFSIAVGMSGSLCVADDLAGGAEITQADAGDVFYLAQQPQPKPKHKPKPKITPQPPPAAKPPAVPPAKPVPTPAPKPKVAQPPAPTITDPQPAPSPIRMPEVGMLASRTPMLRLARVPNMLGDFFNQGGQFASNLGPTTGVTALPVAGGGHRVKVAENNKALPMNRCYLMYHHYHNALTAQTNLTPAGDDFSVNRYTVGLERMFLHDRWSVDLRMPFYESYGFEVGGFGAEGGEIGNLSITLKRLLSSSPCGAVAAGMGIEVPTGSDAHAFGFGKDFTLRNQSVYLSPYIGLLRTPTEHTFLHGFLQVDVPVGGNRLDFGQLDTLGIINEQVLLHIDLSTGYWLYRDPCACWLTGLATLAELHHTSTLQDADIVTLGSQVSFGNLLNQVDNTNVVVGLHAEVRGHTTLRVAGVFPFQEDPDRPFDAEVHVTLNRYY